MPAKQSVHRILCVSLSAISAYSYQIMDFTCNSGFG